MTTTMLDAALDLVLKGWQVLPCNETPRVSYRGVVSEPKSPIGSLVPSGFKDATADAAVVESWWSRFPNAMIGGVVPAPLLVLDVDPRNGGDMNELQDTLGVLPATLTAWSGRRDGGRHLYYSRPVGKLSAARLPNGIDLKVSGYCILPPSIHPVTGEPYRWESRSVAELPQAAVEALRPRCRPQVYQTGTPARGGRSSGLLRAVHEAPEGRRHNVLLWAGCKVFEDGLDPSLLEDLAAAALEAGLPSTEVLAAVDWCRAYGVGEVVR